MRKLLWVLVAVLTLALSVPAAPGQGRGKPPGKGKPGGSEPAEKKKPEAGEQEKEQEKEKEKEKQKKKEDEEREREAAHGRAFGKKDEQAIRAWFANPANRQGLPPGQAKREQLPPGLQRQLQRNGTLPPGLQKRIQPLPQSLENQLPKPPAGVKRVVVAGNVILLEERSSKILDIVQDAVGSGGNSQPSTGVRRTQ